MLVTHSGSEQLAPVLLMDAATQTHQGNSFANGPVRLPFLRVTPRRQTAPRRTCQLHTNPQVPEAGHPAHKSHLNWFGLTPLWPMIKY